MDTAHEEDVSFLLDSLQAEERCERAWSAMTQGDTDDDVWGDVEEHLLSAPHERDHRLRRWKFFGK